MKNKKGFTIVELVIVIAVIAILAGVLIPTFSGVIQKANESAALQKATSTMKATLAMSKTAVIADKTYFVIGDNRRTSHDSRADDVGPISGDAIMGKVTRVLLPFSNFRSVE